MTNAQIMVIVGIIILILGIAVLIGYLWGFGACIKEYIEQFENESEGGE